MTSKAPAAQRALNPALFKHDKSDWETPDQLFALLNDEYRFTLDACANKVNHKCERYFDLARGEDGLLLPWVPPSAASAHAFIAPTERVWINPPYGPAVGQWTAKAILEVQKLHNAELAVLLLPARTDTRWFHTCLWNAEGGSPGPRPGITIEFHKGRLRFKGAPHPAPFPSMIVLVEQVCLWGPARPEQP